MRSFSTTLDFVSTRAPEFIDITNDVVDAVTQSGIDAGIALVFSRHTTAAIKINENEPLLLKDMERFLEAAASKEAYYGHNDFEIRTVHMHEDECPNGHAHCQQLMLGTSEMIPIVDGLLAFGEWQRVFLIELDIPKKRQVIVQVFGGPGGPRNISAREATGDQFTEARALGSGPRQNGRHQIANPPQSRLPLGIESGAKKPAQDASTPAHYRVGRVE